MNRVCLIGRLTKDPQLKTTKSGVSQTTFTLAVNRKQKNDDGTNQADFINCISWRETADTIFKYFVKGKEIGIEGHIQTGSYEAQDGTKRYTTDVVVDFFDFIGNKETTQDKKENAEVQKDFHDPYIENNTQDTKDPFEDFGDIVELDSSELPF